VGEAHFAACWEWERVGRDSLPMAENVEKEKAQA